MTNPYLQKIINVWQTQDQKPPTHIPKIKTSQIAGKLAFVYEKIRNAVEYSEDHLLRKRAIKRIIKRKIIFLPPQLKNSDYEISKSLIVELVRANYLPNDAIPETKIDEISKIIKKYEFLIENLEETKKRKIQDWLICLAACEIEEILVPPKKNNAFVEMMYNYINNNITYDEKINLSDHNKKIQTYFAIHRVLLKSDRETLAFYSLKLFYPNWSKINQTELNDVIQNLTEVYEIIEKQITHPLAEHFQKLLLPWAVPFKILRDAADSSPKHLPNLLSNQDALNLEVVRLCQIRYRNTKTILKRSAVRSIIYIFFTKTILAFILEIPYDLIIVGYINYLPLFSNIIFHPFLMFLIAVTTKVPGPKNTERIKNMVQMIVYGKNQEKIYFKPRKSLQKGTMAFIFFNTFYLLIFLISFGLIISFLFTLKFNLSNGFLFILFLCLVSFFGIRIRQNARELMVINKKENFITFIFDLLTLPLIRAGRWISIKSSNINIFMFVLDFIIEAPFKIIVEVFDEMVMFIKEKKEEIY